MLRGYTRSMTKRTLSGFTLLELLVAIALIAIMATWAVPSFRLMIEKNRVAVEILRLKTALAQTRNAALTRRVPVTLCPTRDQKACLDDWTAPLMIFVNQGNRGVRKSGEPVLKILSASEVESISYSALAGNNHVRFSNLGWPQGYNGSFVICGGQGKATRLVLSRMGRVRIGQESDC